MQPRRKPLGPPFLPVAGPAPRRPAASLPPCSSSTGPSWGQAQPGTGADTAELPAQASHGACAGDGPVPTLTPNLPNCLSWAGRGRLDPADLVGPREQPQNLAAPKGAEKRGSDPRSWAAQRPSLYREAPRARPAPLHGEQETRGQHQPLGAGFGPLFPKRNGNLSSQRGQAAKVVWKKTFMESKSSLCAAILVICGLVRFKRFGGYFKGFGIPSAVRPFRLLSGSALVTKPS